MLVWNGPVAVAFLEAPHHYSGVCAREWTMKAIFILPLWAVSNVESGKIGGVCRWVEVYEGVEGELTTYGGELGREFEEPAQGELLELA